MLQLIFFLILDRGKGAIILFFLKAELNFTIHTQIIDIPAGKKEITSLKPVWQSKLGSKKDLQ